VRIYLENSDDEDKMKTLNLLVFQPTDAGR